MGANGDTLKIERNYRTLRELALERMRDAILELRFRPGQRLVERALCDQLGVSRTVVREVLRHLEAEGLIQTVPHRGPIVTEPTPRDAEEIYEIRALLEGAAARACAARADDATIAALGAAVDRIADAYAAEDSRAVLTATSAFYEILFEGGGKHVAWSIVQTLNARVNVLRAMTISSERRSIEGLAEMRRIQEAVARRDPDGAHTACSDHVRRAAEIAQSLITAP